MALRGQEPDNSENSAFVVEMRAVLDRIAVATSQREKHRLTGEMEAIMRRYLGPGRRALQRRARRRRNDVDWKMAQAGDDGE